MASVGWMSDGRTRPDRSMHHDPMKAKHNSRIMNAWRFHKPLAYRRHWRASEPMNDKQSEKDSQLATLFGPSQPSDYVWSLGTEEDMIWSPFPLRKQPFFCCATPTTGRLFSRRDETLWVHRKMKQSRTYSIAAPSARESRLGGTKKCFLGANSSGADTASGSSASRMASRIPPGGCVKDDGRL